MIVIAPRIRKGKTGAETAPETKVDKVITEASDTPKRASKGRKTASK